MFTGIIEEIGILRERTGGGRSWRLGFRAARILAGTRIGDSIAVDGVCLTVSALLPDGFRADVMPETIRVTTLGGLPPGTRVNLERALAAGDRLGGHVVSGHVDAVARILARTRCGNAEVVRIGLPPTLRPFLVRKGSIAVDGTSLTVLDLDDTSFRVSLIPHTRALSVIGTKRPGDRVNLEGDQLARYVVMADRMRQGFPAHSGHPCGEGMCRRGHGLIGVVGGGRRLGEVGKGERSESPARVWPGYTSGGDFATKSGSTPGAVFGAGGFRQIPSGSGATMEPSRSACPSRPPSPDGAVQAGNRSSLDADFLRRCGFS